MLSTDLKVYKAKSNGRMDNGELVTSGALQNVFPHVTSAQRTAGHFDYRKVFWKVADDSDGTLLDPYVLHDFPTLSDTDYMTLFSMTQRGRVEDITGYATGTDSERKYGVAMLSSNITAGASTIVCQVKNGALATGNDAIFADGDKIKLSDKATADASSGNEEVLTISGAPVVTDTTTITITVSETIANSYTADGSICRVSSLFEPSSDTETSATTPVVTSSAGTLDTSTYPLILDNIGTVDEDWTITFTDATNFTLTGDTLGTVATGTISGDLAPTNNEGSLAQPYFTLEYEAFGGTFAAGDTITFTTHPAAIPIGQKRLVPAGSSSLANNKCTLVLVGEAV